MTISKKTMAIASGAGLFVGVLGAYLFQCPQNSYPACYHQTLDQGFNSLEGLTYKVDHHWLADGSLKMTIYTNVLCPAETQVFVGQFPEGLKPAEARNKGAIQMATAQFMEIEKTAEFKVPAAQLKKGYETFVSLTPQAKTAKMFETENVQNIYLKR